MRAPIPDSKARQLPRRQLAGEVAEAVAVAAEIRTRRNRADRKIAQRPLLGSPRPTNSTPKIAVWKIGATPDSPQRSSFRKAEFSRAKAQSLIFQEPNARASWS